MKPFPLGFTLLYLRLLQFLHLTAPTAAKAGHSVQCSNVTKELFKSRKTANMLDFYRSVGPLVGELSFFSLPFLSRLYC